MAPDLARFEQAYAGQVQFIDIDVDVDNATSERYKPYKRTDYIPETMILKKGQVVFQKEGSFKFDELKQIVDPLLRS